MPKGIKATPFVCSVCQASLKEKYHGKWICGPCQYKKHKNWVIKNRNHVNEWRRKYNVTYRKTSVPVNRYKERYQILIDAKSKPCVDCKNIFPIVCMDFDHVYGEKLFTVGNSKTRSEKALRDEIAKCEVVCSNCHRIRTERRRLEQSIINTEV